MNIQEFNKISHSLPTNAEIIIKKPSNRINLAFILTMPNCGSWDGKWSGAKNLHVIFKSLTSKKAIEKHKNLIGKNFHYSWNDGWGANIEVKSISSEEKRRMKKANAGFCGYDWMVNNILFYGNPYGEEKL